VQKKKEKRNSVQCKEILFFLTVERSSNDIRFLHLDQFSFKFFLQHRVLTKACTYHSALGNSAFFYYTTYFDCCTCILYILPPFTILPQSRFNQSQTL
jgi:hypothetical protein